MQTYFRVKAIRDLNENSHLDSRLLLGFRGNELAACIAHEQLSGSGLETPLRNAFGFDGPIRNFKAIGVALSHRRSGGIIADLAMQEAFNDMLERENASAVLVMSRIHLQNEPSQALARRKGLAQVAEVPTEEPYRNWVAIIEVSEE